MKRETANNRRLPSNNEERTSRIANAVSAGGVVLRRQNTNLEIVICGRSQPTQWSLPKGTPEYKETITQTALREVREETGLNVVLEEPIGQIKYVFQSSDNKTVYHKTVHFFLMRFIGGSTDRHDSEFDQVCWVPIEKGICMLSYPNEVQIVKKAKQISELRWFHDKE